MTEFAVQVEERDAAVVIVRIAGELTIERIDSLRRKLSLVEHRAKDGTVVLDVAGLTFISSLGLGALVAFRNALGSRGVSLRLSGATDPIVEVFRRTRLVELFPMYTDPEQALAADAEGGADPK